MDPNENNLPLVREKIFHKFPKLYDWISSFPYYYELKNYIFVHGGIDGSNKLWKETTSRKQFTWGKEYDYEPVEDKIVVCGHTRVATVRKKVSNYKELFKTSNEMFDILYLDGKIMIDRYVEITKEINVLVLEL
jgi:serine/threonine protein phosphatase 1